MLFESVGSVVTECRPSAEENYWHSFKYVLTMH